MRIAELNLKLSHDDLRDAMVRHGKSCKREYQIRASHRVFPTDHTNGVLRKIDIEQNTRVSSLHARAINLREAGLKSDLIDSAFNQTPTKVQPVQPSKTVADNKRKKWFFGLL